MAPCNISLKMLSFFGCVLFIVLCLDTSTGVFSANIPSSEMAALYDFYNATDGSNWECCKGNNTRWNFSNPAANPCLEDWEGITCTFPAPFSYYYIEKLELAEHNMTGSIPASIGNLSHLSDLRLDSNYLSSTIPSSVEYLSSLGQLELTNNRLNGTIPTGVSNLTRLELLVLAGNRLTGTLHSSLGSLATLHLLLLHGNALSGTIPESFGSLSSLMEFDLTENPVTGTIPLSFCDLTGLDILVLEGNSLSGTIPSCFGNNMHLRFILLSDNYLTGPIPNNFTQMSDVWKVHFTNNFLTGTIPVAIGEMGQLSYIHFNQNLLTGTIPAGYSQCTDMKDLDLSVNLFTGTIPSVLTFKYLENLYLEGNSFTGTLPDFFESYPKLQDLNVGTNFFRGTIPQSLGLVPNLAQLFLEANSFTGTLGGIFTNQTDLYTIQLNDNQLTGTLPEDLFALPDLDTFIATTNCFHGSLPENICTSTKASTLVLNGLSSASECLQILLPFVSKAYVLQYSVGGTIPSCLFRLKYLTSLQLSGNGFQGGFPDDIDSLSSYFTDLVLSHNIIDGGIPDYIQEHQWSNLDLSFNRITGTLRSDFATSSDNSSLSLQNNRLSGEIPSMLFDMLDISLLGSNIFKCSLGGGDLPEHDSGRNGYQCGSNDFDYPFFLWVVFMCSLFVGMWRISRGSESLLKGSKMQRMIDWWSVCNSSGDRSTSKSFAHVGQFFDDIYRLTLACVAFICFIMGPVYGILSYEYGTYTYQYAYTLSAAFLNGYVVFSVELTLWLLLVGIVFYWWTKYGVKYVVKRKPEVNDVTTGVGSDTTSTTMYDVGSGQDPSMEGMNDRQPSSSFNKTTWKYWQICALYTFVNLTIVAGVNIGYVLIAIDGTYVQVLFALLFLSFFKLVWNQKFSTVVLLSTIDLVSPDFFKRTKKDLVGHFVTLQIYIGNLNNVIIPCLAVFTISPNCFYSVFVAPPEITADYTVYQCSLSIAGECRRLVPVTSRPISYHPPYSYSYQCGSSLITYYAPVFMSLCIMSCVVPLVKVVLVHFHERADVTSKWYMLLKLSLVHLLRPIPDDNVIDNANVPILFDANSLLVNLSTNLTLMMTFGAVFPPVSVALAANVCVIIACKRLELGRFVLNAREKGQLKYVAAVEEECQAVGSNVMLSLIQVMICISCVVYTLFLFDTVGDDVGVGKAYWIFICIPVIPLFVYVSQKFYTEKYGMWSDTEVGQAVLELGDREKGQMQ